MMYSLDDLDMVESIFEDLDASRGQGEEREGRRGNIH